MKAFALFALVVAAGSAQASVVIPGALLGSATFTGVNSIDAQGSATNNTGSAVIVPGGSVASVRAFGTLNLATAGTFASEARVRFSAGAGNAFSAFNFQHTSIGAYPASGTVNFDTTTNVTPFALTNGGTVNFEWFESFQDSAGVPESTFAPVTYEFRSAATLQNGSFNFGTLASNGVTAHYNGSHVSGGLDFITFTLSSPVANLGDYLNIRMLAGTTGTSMSDTEIALYGPDGSFIATDDDGATGFFSQLSYGAADPFPSGSDILPGSSGLSLAAGTYTLVTGGFNTTFASSLSGTFTPGTNSGTYDLAVTFVPAPGAMALLGLGGLVATRRRRA
ncbi:MAG: PEP-CTERM sorting domain-containing protein [Phycisphaerales bacterium]|jgi:MYXO-CTERM domain-containing protein